MGREYLSSVDSGKEKESRIMWYLFRHVKITTVIGRKTIITVITFRMQTDHFDCKIKRLYIKYTRNSGILTNWELNQVNDDMYSKFTFAYILQTDRQTDRQTYTDG